MGSQQIQAPTRFLVGAFFVILSVQPLMQPQVCRLGVKWAEEIILPVIAFLPSYLPCGCLFIPPSAKPLNNAFVDI